jgi:prepilin-type N-terminal cleavage/methylation domain-containing protein
MRPSRRVGGDRGESLLELVIAIAILGVCVVAIGTGMALSVKISDIHRGQAIAQQYLHDDAELLENTNSYVACTASTSPNYPALVTLPAPPDGGPWTVTQSDLKFWNGTRFVAGCPAAGDPGLQQVTLAIKRTNGPVNDVNESLVLVIRSAT